MSKVSMNAGGGGNRTSARSVRARILRYPNGRERRILYPQDRDNVDAGQRTETKVGAAASETAGSITRTSNISPAEVRGTDTSSVSEVPSSPMALLAKIRNPALRREREEEEAVARASYSLHEGCPFDNLSTQVYVVVNVSSGEVCCASVLTKDTRPNILGDAALDAIISRDVVAQGLLIFPDEAAGESYMAALLKEGGNAEADMTVCEVGAGDIFMLASASGSLGIVFKPGHTIPSPTILRQVLRARDSSPEENIDF